MIYQIVRHNHTHKVVFECWNCKYRVVQGLLTLLLLLFEPCIQQLICQFVFGDVLHIFRIMCLADVASVGGKAAPRQINLPAIS